MFYGWFMCIIYSWSILSLSGLWLMYPDWVPVLRLFFWLLFMLSFLGASCPVSWSSLPSIIFVPVMAPSSWSGVLSSCHPLWYVLTCVSATYGLSTLLCSSEFVSVNMSFRHQVPITMCSLKYYFAIICVLQMCLVLHVIRLPIYFTLTMYDHPL